MSTYRSRSETPSSPASGIERIYRKGPDPALAVILELVPGLFLQTFGIGNIYAGRVMRGVLMMAGYWVAAGINVFLCQFVVGFVTWPLTWLAFMVFCPMLARRAVLAREAEV